MKTTSAMPVAAGPVIEPVRLAWNLKGLLALATFTDQIWVVNVDTTGLDTEERGLGLESRENVTGVLLGSRVRLMMELECDGHLLLLDQSPEGKVYCLCPSKFAANTRVSKGHVSIVFGTGFALNLCRSGKIRRVALCDVVAHNLSRAVPATTTQT